jgi:hypothetical protein
MTPTPLTTDDLRALANDIRERVFPQTPQGHAFAALLDERADLIDFPIVPRGWKPGDSDE